MTSVRKQTLKEQPFIPPPTMSSITAEDPSCLFDTSWTIYEIRSTLKYGEQYQDLLQNHDALHVLARDLKIFFDSKGHIDNDGDSDDGHVGSLHRVDVSQISDSVEDESGVILGGRGILITFVYERASYKTALFRGGKFDSQHGNDVARIPLLLVRMPAHLSKRLFEFFSSSFEVSVLPAKIPTFAMYRLLGNYLDTLSTATGDQSNDATELLYSVVIKDLKISFTFENSVSPQLRLFEVNVPNSVLCECVDRTPPARNARALTRKSGNTIIEALGAFFDKHMGLQIPTPGRSGSFDLIKVAKVACGAFVLAADGKFKLISKVVDHIPSNPNLQSTSQATQGFLDGIVEIVTGQNG